MRVLITYVVPLIAPAVLYFFWVVLTNGKKGGKRRLVDGPWLWLAFAGLALAILVLMGIAYFSGEAPGGQYQAPRLENGKIIPGHVERQTP
jgi:hypothetical protein